MKLSILEIENAANLFLDTLDREGITEVSDITDRIGRRIKVNRDTEIEFSSRPCLCGTRAGTISFIRNGTGIIELRLNPIVDYGKIIAILQTYLPDYDPFYKDGFGNYAQEKIIAPANYTALRRELESLTFLRN